MKSCYKRKNFDLDSLVEAIELFFKNKKFNTRTVNGPENMKRIKATIQERGEVRSAIVKIVGKPEDFTVEFTGGEHAQSILRLSSLMSLFGGPVLLRVYQRAEFYQKLEEEFWDYVDKFVVCSTS